MEKLFTWEQTEKTETGLDVLIKYDGQWIAWAYTKESAEMIVNTLNGDAVKNAPKGQQRICPSGCGGNITRDGEYWDCDKCDAQFFEATVTI